MGWIGVKDEKFKYYGGSLKDPIFIGWGEGTKKCPKILNPLYEIYEIFGMICQMMLNNRVEQCKYVQILLG